MLWARAVDATRGLGMFSAMLLVATLLWQLRLQWKKGTARGVSRFLFVGQLGASTGFAIYSAQIGDDVFVATNVATGIAAITGALLTFVLKRRDDRRSWRGSDAECPAETPGHGVASSTSPGSP